VKQFTIYRMYLPLGTQGELADEAGYLICFTIERPQTGDHPCVAEGTYTASRYNSPTHGPNTWQLNNVPGRSNIQFHICKGVNGQLLDYVRPHFLLGCISPGLLKMEGPGGEPGVANSKAAYDRFMALTAGETKIEFTFKKAST
jgi:hypothetical protein